MQDAAHYELFDTIFKRLEKDPDNSLTGVFHRKIYLLKEHRNIARELRRRGKKNALETVFLVRSLQGGID
jgi:hypothetical protein